MARAPRRSGFGPQALSRHLAELLPPFPQLAVCVAFSGGADSTALLAALAQLPRPPLKVRAVHIDHHLHPHSARWSAHCRRVAKSLAVPLTVRSARIVRARGESLEAAARAARYRLLAAALAPAELLLTAHHADDQLETVLLQLLRGAGLAGLAAMPAQARFAGGSLLRPLLPWTHAELTAWVSAQRLKWLEDPSNAELRLDRGYLRERVLPALRARWPAAAATVARTARHAAEAQRLLDALGAADVARASSGARLAAPVLRALPPERRRNALRHWIASAGFRPPPAARLAEIEGPLLNARVDAQPVVRWQGTVLEREGELLRLRASAAPRGGRADAPQVEATSWEWRRRARCAVPGAGTLSLRRDPHGPLDLERLPATLSVRTRGGGERLRPRSGGPRRALKSLLQEARVPPALRARLPLVFAGETLVAVAGLLLDESVQAGADSRRRARLIFSAD